MTGGRLAFGAEGGADGGVERGAMAHAGRRVRLRALAVLALTFVTGVASGWAAKSMDRPARGAGSGGGQGPRRGLLGRGDMERLGVTPVQRAAIDSVLQARRGQIDAFWRGPGAQLRVILDSTRQDVRAILDSSQRVTFDSIQAEQRRRAEARFRSRGGEAGAGAGRERR